MVCYVFVVGDGGTAYVFLVYVEYTTDRIFYIKGVFTEKGPGNLTGKQECESNRP